MFQSGRDLSPQRVTESPPESVDRHLEGRFVHPDAPGQLLLVAMACIPGEPGLGLFKEFAAPLVDAFLL